MIRNIIISLLILSVILVGNIFAQTSGGQICVRAFEDRNGNGADDGSEPRITRGLNATLANADGIIIQTGLMEDSLNAAVGTLCFQRLPAGQYTMHVISADYNPTTATEFVTALTDTGIQTFYYGGQIIVSNAPSGESGTADLSDEKQRNLMVRLIFAGLGAAVVMGAMALVGVAIYLIFLRPASQPRYATGTYPAVQSPTSTGSMPQVDVISPLAKTNYVDEDTDRSRPIATVDEDTDRSRPIDAVDEEIADKGDDPDAPFKPPQD